ncbi:hypothetical protein [Serratia odorifera]|uniref:Uncharacterized protein n=2 Tax=Serratia odorifera TaxID=618 RepID=D4E1P5_SEROD|nr:hypothetical protein [Serratia odorifera]EFE96270.1 hypothetical protein HMPREF0758_2095 [Serratia odorifera DSM 4582]PNK90862.1 hypothetical protein CEQ31_014835 [Serratia odorifera]RII71960.1 hypothetical protein DX901_11525 [Serratia odorifera]VDZ57776.1 Uncharacterised protein [Serratia odorifera]
MKKTVIYIVSLVALFSASNVAMRTIEVKNDNQFSCTARYTTQMNDVQINSIIRFIFNDGDGIATLDGSMIDGPGPLKTVSRKVLFKYDRKNTSYFLMTTNASVQLDDESNTDEMKKNVPDFYLIKDATINFDIYPLKQNSYLFTSRKIPSFYCTK